jgi:hypothetical protein
MAALGLIGLACVCAVMGAWRSSGGAGSVSHPASPGPQCGHWCIRRCCELLGAPVEMPAILEMLPRQEGGHSMLQLARVLKTIGLKTEGRRETLDTLAEASFPVIVHLKNPDHFVVATAVENGRVHLFDGWGRRTSRAVRTFEVQWSGNVLLVRRDRDSGPLPVFSSFPSESAPRIQFDTLFVDKGDLASDGEPVSFLYRFQNLGITELIIKKIRPDCTCIKTEHPDQPVPPGGTGIIQLLYHPPTGGGLFFHQAVVETNDPHLPLVKLKATGFFDVQVSAHPDRLDFDEVVAGQNHSAVVFIKYTGVREDFTVDKATCSFEGIKLSTYSTQTDRARKWWPDAGSSLRVEPGVFVVEVSFIPSKQMSGKIEATLLIQTNISKFSRISVPVTALVVKPMQIREME